MPFGSPPIGNKNQSSSKPWKDAINRALSKKGTCERAEELYLIAREVVESAQDKSNPNFKFAVQEVGQRLDGKATEHIDLRTDEGTAAGLIGISAALMQLSRVTGVGEIIDGEVIVQDRSLLPSEVCAEAGGHGEGVDLSEMSGCSGEP